jgi:hypothetical protein
MSAGSGSRSFRRRRTAAGCLAEAEIVDHELRIGHRMIGVDHRAALGIGHRAGGGDEVVDRHDPRRDLGSSRPR